MNNPRKVELKYNLNTDGVGGMMVADNVADQISIKVDSPYFDNDYDVSLSHPNYLSTKFINRDEQRPERIYESFDRSLGEYVETLGDLTYSYSDRTNKYYFLNPKIIQVIQVMIKFVTYLHHQELVFHPHFKLDYQHNFGVIGETVKFWKLSLDKRPGKTYRGNDWLQIARIIEDNILGSLQKNQYPVLLSDFINNHLKKYKGVLRFQVNRMNFVVDCENFFPHHLGLLSHSQRIGFVKNCVDKRDGLISYNRSLFMDALYKMPIQDGWISRLTTAFTSVKENLTFHCLKQTDARVTMNSIRSLTWTDDEFVVKVRLLYKDIMENNSGGLFVRLEMLRLCRNLATHLMDSLSDPSTVQVEDIVIDASLMQLFGKELLLLQENLFYVHLLDYFMI